VIGHVVYPATCLVAVSLLVVAGYAHKVVGLTNALGKGVRIADSPSVGAMNILVMGLESRTNFADGRKATGFSIPRDDVVDFPHATLDGLTEGKIDAAYDFAWDLPDFATDMSALSGKNLSGAGSVTVALNAPYGIPCVY
jgi:hypothetical protein